MSLNARQEAFAKEVVRNGGDKVEAYKVAGYSQKLSSAAMSVEADKLYNHPKISLKVSELKKVADKVAKEKFNISVEQRLIWLSEVREAGMSTYRDQIGNERRENLNAANASIKTMNEMLGVDESGDGVKPVKVIIGVNDASRP